MRIIPYTQEELKELFKYDRWGGQLSWRDTKGKHKHNVGYRTKKRWIVELKGKSYSLDKVIWKWMTGDDVPAIEHLNSDFHDDRWCNLKLAPDRSWIFELEARNQAKKRFLKNVERMRKEYVELEAQGVDTRIGV